MFNHCFTHSDRLCSGATLLMSEVKTTYLLSKKWQQKKILPWLVLSDLSIAILKWWPGSMNVLNNWWQFVALSGRVVGSTILFILVSFLISYLHSCMFHQISHILSFFKNIFGGLSAYDTCQNPKQILLFANMYLLMDRQFYPKKSYVV